MAQLSRTEERLLESLRRTPVQSQKQLAASVGISRETCREYLNRLTASGHVLGKGYLLKPEPQDLDIAGYILIKSPTSAVGVGRIKDLLEQAPNVASYSMVSGHDYDYVAFVRGNLRSPLMRNLILELRNIDGTDTQTLVVLG